MFILNYETWSKEAIDAMNIGYRCLKADQCTKLMIEGFGGP